ncbi:MAG: TIGR00341 family protein [Leptospiraceae bacterium]|nr:TIGR00341 family protein [Leptospiraceae bacterium]MCP5512232.1 TIGR00341 family protein [Leptospiraceae bacterium]
MNESPLNMLILEIKKRFELHEGKASDQEIIEDIREGAELSGTNLWVLILAIFIASIGLNVNSTAVIIGAMLISPLMGPIMGIGLGVGIFDFELIKKSFLNLTIAAIFSILTSCFYFLISPLGEAHSELLARTTPSIWDVIIAFVGGLAGVIASTRKEKTNVLPGVAIATALMPPLCTAGYGIAKGNIYFFFGAFYLFFINSVFISLATFILIRFMKFPRITFVDQETESKVKKFITGFVLITILPSIFLAYKIVTKSIFETKVNVFLKKEFNYRKTLVLYKDIDFASKKVEVLIAGEKISKNELSSLNEKLKDYNLEDTTLIIKDNNANLESELNNMKANILDEVLKKNSETIEQKNERIKKLELELANYKDRTFNTSEIYEELKAQYPNCESLVLESSKKAKEESINLELVTIAIAKFSGKLNRNDKKKIIAWLKVRTKSENLEFYIE